MRILLVGNYRADRQYSMLSYEQSLARELPANGVNVSIVYPRARLGRIGVPSRLAKWAGYIDKFVLFPRELRRLNGTADLVHILDQGNGMWVPLISDLPHLVTVHDLLASRASLGEFPDWKIGRSGMRFQQLIRRGLAQARHVVTVSQATRSDFMRLFPGAPEPDVILHGTFRPLEQMPRASALEALASADSMPDAPFVLHIGGNQPYKNRLGAVRIFKALRRLPGFGELRLALAGHPLSDQIRQSAAAEISSGVIVEVVRPTDHQVNALYSLAEALLFPSFVEGYGVPVIEAQACGCPVFASNRAPLPEVGGDGAVYFDPANPEEAARRIAASWPGRSALVSRGFANVAERTPGRCAAAHAALYRRILGMASNK